MKRWRKRFHGKAALIGMVWNDFEKQLRLFCGREPAWRKCLARFDSCAHGGWPFSYAFRVQVAGGEVIHGNTEDRNVPDSTGRLVEELGSGWVVCPSDPNVELKVVGGSRAGAEPDLEGIKGWAHPGKYGWALVARRCGETN